MSDDAYDETEGNNSVALVRTLKQVQIAETIEGLRDVKQTRAKLGEFTVRDMHEAIYGEDFTKIVLGEHGGEYVKMSELDVKFTGSSDGQLRTQVMDRTLLEHRPVDQEEVARVLRERDDQLDEQNKNNPEYTRAALERNSVEDDDPPMTDFDFSSLTPEETAALTRLLAKAKK